MLIKLAGNKWIVLWISLGKGLKKLFIIPAGIADNKDLKLGSKGVILIELPASKILANLMKSFCLLANILIGFIVELNCVKTTIKIAKKREAEAIVNNGFNLYLWLIT